MKIAIIGNGMIGATCAYYLSQKKEFEIDLYDDNFLSGTQAAVGIVAPWVTQRRNKAWYHLVKEGADFYTQLINDLQNSSFKEDTGVLIIHPSQHDKLLNLAYTRLKESPIMKSVVPMTSHPNIPQDFKFEKGFFIEGAFRIDGKQYLKVLDKMTPDVHKINATANLKDILDLNYDKVLLACGGRTQDILNDIHIKLDHSAQKGMLLEFPYPKNQSPIIMPQGEIDFIFKETSLIIGASHEKEYMDTNFDPKVFESLVAAAQKYMPINTNDYTYRIGLRSFNSKNLPFFGNFQTHPNLYCAAGLGSSGLSSGPYIGYLLAQHFIHNIPLDPQYSVNQFVK